MPLENYVQAGQQMAEEVDAVRLVQEVVEHPQIFVFGELFEVPVVRALKESPNSAKWFNLLELFAYGKLSDYNEQAMPPLTEAMVKKLRLLTIVTLGTNKSKKIAYSVLSEELKLANLRDLEDLIIEAVYANLIRGKLDQKAGCLEIEWTLARDVRADRFEEIGTMITSWISNCESILSNIDRQAKIANTIKTENTAKRAELENYITTVRKTLKVTNDERMDDVWELNSMQHHEFDRYEKSKRAMHKPTSRFSLKNRNRF